MKRWLGLLLGLAGAHLEAAELTPDELRYTLTLIRKPLPMVEARLAVRGSPTGETILAVNGAWGGADHFERSIHGVRVEDGRGRPLAVERASPTAWKVRHPPGEPLTATWFLIDEAPAEADDTATHFRVHVEERRMLALPLAALLVPRHLGADGAGEEPRPIALALRGFKEAGWKVAHSFGDDPRGARVRMPIDRFTHALIAAGSDLRLLRRDAAGQPLDLAVIGSWTFSEAELADLAAKILAEHRRFFDEKESRRFLIALYPLTAPARAGSSSTRGTALTDSFVILLQPDATIRHAGQGSVAWLLAHELFHQWNGSVIERREPSVLASWFSEGFTNFYARRALFRAGLIDREGWIEDGNRALADYLLSPEREASNQRASDAFWSSRELKDLIYHRGDVAAMWIDHAIRKRSGGARSLDDLMKQLARDRAKVDSDSLITAIAALTDEKFGAALKKTVIDGALPALPDDLFAPCLAGARVPRQVYQLGFDERAAHGPTYRIDDVVPGSAAWKAGLRGGEMLRGWSVHFGRADVPVELELRDGRKMKFLPAGKPVEVLELREAPGASDETCRIL